MDIAVHRSLSRTSAFPSPMREGGIRIPDWLFPAAGVRVPMLRRCIQKGHCLAICLLAAWLLTAGAYEPSVSLVFLGDIMLGRGVAEAHADGGWESILRSLKRITRSADLALANLESPIFCNGTAAADLGPLAAPAEASAALDSAGLDILTMVNNHASDAGPDGKRCTYQALAALGMASIQSPEETVEVRIRGLSLVFLAADFTGETPPDAVDSLERRIRLASGAGKVVVVSLHWGLEYQSGRDPLQERIASRLAGSHADILWGHHPHVVQEIEWKSGTLVMYSLGNAVFDQREPDAVRRGTLVWANVDRFGVRSIFTLPFAIDPNRGETEGMDVASFRIAFAPTRLLRG
jgi:poly-gamma-glutamate capsule biosynthesis protein CapA/YwtB (metallophosphatase superfamily)